MNAFQSKYGVLYKRGAFCVTVVSALLIFFSSQRQSITVDEPNHIYCGMEYLQYGSYTAWPENPILSRAIVAIGPYVKGYRIGKVPSERDYFFASYSLDYFSNSLIKNKLVWARIFVLPVFLISVFVVWVWAKSLGGPEAAFLATGMYATLPVILAHSGLATTDMTFTASFVILLWRFACWLKKPSPLNASWLGISMSMCLLAKYSVLLFFPVAACIMVLLFLLASTKDSSMSVRQRLIPFFKTGVLAIVICALVIWLFHGFSFGKLSEVPVVAAGLREGKVKPWMGNLYLPAPEWFAGVKLLYDHNARGHRSYLFGQLSQHGFKMFYPVALFLKTPLPFILLMIMGFFGTVWPLDRKKWQLLAMFLVPIFILVSLIPSNINLGLRHILCVYAFGAIAGAVGTCRLLTNFAHVKTWARNIIPPGLVASHLIITALAFPNYLSYFNPVAGREPGAIIAGSDLDWGQGLYELSEFCKNHKIDTLNLAYYGTAKDCWYSLPPVKFLADSVRATGWIAVSEYLYRGVWVGDATKSDSCNLFDFTSKPGKTLQPNNSYRWLDKYPLIGKAGGSIRIYHVPDIVRDVSTIGKK